MKTTRAIILSAALLAPLAALSCKDTNERMGEGFRLPEGSIENGKSAFLKLECNQCHTLAGETLPKPELESPLQLELGGEVRRVKSYGELVTAITQPQHIVSQEYLKTFEKDQRGSMGSPMPDFNDRMTVTQLADIVTFLHARYQKAAPPGVTYPIYAY